METTKKVQVLLLDDDDDLREGMKWMFETVDLPMQGFATFESFKNRLDEYVNSDSGLCLLLDLRMPDMSGLEVFEWLKRSGYSLDRLPVIFLTGHGDISTAVEAVKNGAFDFYEKPTTDQRLVERVKQALQKSGEFLVNLEVLKQWSERIDRLSPREREVLQLLADGLGVSQISRQLFISDSTTKTHISKLYDKLGAGNRAQALMTALRLGLLEAPDDAP